MRKKKTRVTFKIIHQMLFMVSHNLLIFLLPMAQNTRRFLKNKSLHFPKSKPYHRSQKLLLLMRSFKMPKKASTSNFLLVPRANNSPLAYFSMILKNQAVSSNSISMLLKTLLLRNRILMISSVSALTQTLFRLLMMYRDRDQQWYKI